MKIWVDIDNAPHVPVLRPLIREFQAAGHEVVITARAHGQTLPLLDLYELPYTSVSSHAGGNPLRKVAELLGRSALLYRTARRAAFDLAVCHGARGIVLPSRLLGIPLVYMTDYEPGIDLLLRKLPQRTLVPEVIPDDDLERFGLNLGRVRKFPGLKEELYIYDFEPDPDEIAALGLDLARPIVLVRPPATMAHYHTAESEQIFAAALDLLRARPDVQALMLPRTREQERELRASLAGAANFVFPERVAHGPNLLWHADVVVGGGGTMNREAACLGLPVFSVFRGAIGAVDRHLHAEGRMVLVDSPQQLQAMSFEKRVRQPLHELQMRSAGLKGTVARLMLDTVNEWR